ncbi:MarR family winged helix-turn-helix transcriptional regulator [Streptomyces sp. NPDC056161]|uniref:MarR family winged helix-turn-helix transcriptional regulator n=1 Tax=Streptomyces sp. NPDC056161 TaxID=3345732 RepID=UPI0035DEE94A
MADTARYEELIRQFSAFGAVRRELGRILPDGCSNGSVAVLALLSRCGDLRIGELADLLAVDMSVASRQVGQLVGQGLIDRFPDPADGRSRILRLTPEGRYRLGELHGRTARLLARRLSDWTDDEVGELARLMHRLRASFDDSWSEPAPSAAPSADGRTTRPSAITT